MNMRNVWIYITDICIILHIITHNLQEIDNNNLHDYIHVQSISHTVDILINLCAYITRSCYNYISHTLYTLRHNRDTVASILTRTFTNHT
jgi:hypothetical protein